MPEYVYLCLKPSHRGENGDFRSQRPEGDQVRVVAGTTIATPFGSNVPRSIRNPDATDYAELLER